MMKYLRLLRLQDQHLPFEFAIAAGIFLQVKDSWIILWALATTCLSITAHIVNEIIDREDVDKFSWNPVHASKGERLHMSMVWAVLFLFSLLGLFIAYSVGLFWWGLAMYIVGLAYSLEPIRLKGRFILDILAQMFAFGILPFLAPIWQKGRIDDALPLAFTLSFLVWSIVYPYQLADFIADKRADLKCTHVVLGIQKSLWLGVISGIIGIIAFFTTESYLIAPWIWVFVVLVVYTLFQYSRWLGIKTIEKQTVSMQLYVKRAKPILQGLVAFFLILFYLS